ncbi:MAG: hypothetical protein JSW20_11000 [Nitrospiraceae bacterium]|nr:MAG: hypothetical protein JSW20_11000 [Nitrospiraceae bacterium]
MDSSRKIGNIVYHEETHFFSLIFFIILAFIMAAALLLQVQGMGSALPLIIAALALPLLFGRMLITVDGRTLRISFGYLNLIKKEIPLADIREARVVEYRPVRQFGGWGIRTGTFEGKRTGCYSMRGSRGVLISLAHDIGICLIKTNRVIVERVSPEKLKASLKI